MLNYKELIVKYFLPQSYGELQQFVKLVRTQEKALYSQIAEMLCENNIRTRTGKFYTEKTVRKFSMGELKTRSRKLLINNGKLLEMQIKNKENYLALAIELNELRENFSLTIANLVTILDKNGVTEIYKKKLNYNTLNYFLKTVK